MFYWKKWTWCAGLAMIECARTSSCLWPHPSPWDKHCTGQLVNLKLWWFVSTMHGSSESLAETKYNECAPNQKPSHEVASQTALKGELKVESWNMQTQQPSRKAAAQCQKRKHRILHLSSPAFEDPRRCCINELICFRDVLSCWNSGNLLDSKQTGHFWV